MPEFSFVILYVNDPPASAAFYSNLLGRPVIETSPSFAMLPFRDGVMLGLWSRQTVEPSPTSPAGAGEIAFTVADAATVDATYADWSERGLAIVQTPTRMDFGHSFLALDPDGHRLRVFAPEGA